MLGVQLFEMGGYILADRNDNPFCPYCTEVLYVRIACVHSDIDVRQNFAMTPERRKLLRIDGNTGHNYHGFECFGRQTKNERIFTGVLRLPPQPRQRDVPRVLLWTARAFAAARRLRAVLVLPSILWFDNDLFAMLDVDMNALDVCSLADKARYSARDVVGVRGLGNCSASPVDGFDDDVGGLQLLYATADRILTPSCVWNMASATDSDMRFVRWTCSLDVTELVFACLLSD